MTAASKRSRTRARKRKTRAAETTPPPPPPPSLPSPAFWWIVTGIAVVLTVVTVWAWPPRPAPEPHVVRGNQHYAARQFRDALGEYESAPGSGPRNAGVHLDRGLARYRIVAPPPDGGGLPMFPPDSGAPEGYSQAQDEMRTASRGGTTGAVEDVDAMLRAHAAYDLGNTFFTQHSWDNAISEYKEALRLRPGWRDAAWNLELARRLRDLERNPPDAGQDASPDVAQDTSNDAHDAATDAQDSGMDSGPDANDGGGDGANDTGAGDTGSGDSGAGDSGAQGDSGSQGDGGSQGDSGPQSQPDGGAQNQRDAAAPRSMAPLDDLDRTSHSLQDEILRRRPAVPRSPDEDK